MMKDWEFAYTCGSFGGAQTSDDGYIIPIAKTKPFDPSMSMGGPPPGGARYRLEVADGDAIAFRAEVTALWITHHKSGAVWLALTAGDDWCDVAQALHAFAGKPITLAFVRL